jgi:hypothetical protein
MLGRPALALLSVAAFVAIPGATAAPPATSACGSTIVTTSFSPVPVSIDLTTGRDDSTGTPIAHTQPDDTWTTFLPAAGPAYSVDPNTAWAPPGNAAWVNSRTTRASNGTRTTTFRTTFTLAPEVTERVLNLEYAADNGVLFYLNNHLIGGFDPPDTSSNATLYTAFHQVRPLAWSGAFFQNGQNVLDAVVSDYGVATGLLVRGAFSGCDLRGADPTVCVDVDPTTQRVLAYSPAPVDLGTGEDGYVRHSIGAVDPDWRTVTTTGLADTDSVEKDPAWFAGSHTNWINSTADRHTGHGGIDVDLEVADGTPQLSLVADPGTPGSTRTYRFTFTLPSDLRYGGVEFQYGADNDVVLTLNNTLIGAAADAFRAPHEVSLAKAPLVPGTNVLEAKVTDYGVVTGFLAEGGIFACRGRAAS